MGIKIQLYYNFRDGLDMHTIIKTFKSCRFQLSNLPNSLKKNIEPQYGEVQCKRKQTAKQFTCSVKKSTGADGGAAW